ncbi:plastin-2-like [Sycon ciliatum]|uniref:plastin-2-like n=1 Tax=Sycon ciliatum TaxID=27933 RepID=UPI0020AC8559|eukprot:scpid52866/ scgid30790/ Plastin-2; 65 kDa macrophage protein; L-plastin; Lymphocyte cytosolic protein 1; pp65
MSFTEEELAEFRSQFDTFDIDRNGHITCTELTDVFKALGESVPGYKVRELIAEVDKDKNGTVEWGEFLTMMEQVRSKKTKFGLAEASEKTKKLVKVEGMSAASSAGTTHSFDEDETVSFSDWINYVLKDDADVQSKLPIGPGDLFDAGSDGILLCKLINASVEGTIDERAINKKKPNNFKIHENQTLVLNSASAIGCSVVNIGAEDLISGKPHLVLGLMWQIIRIGLLAKISLKNNPNLAVLLNDGESLADFLKLSPEEILLRWFNYHLEKAGHGRRVRNFSGDIKDSECYTILLSQIAPADSGVDRSPLQESDLNKRADRMLQQADKIGCRAFVRPADVTKGNAKLNLAFVANLFNMYPALEPSEEGLPDFDLGDFDETREEKTFRNWMNSLGVTPFVNNLYSDLSDGHVLLELMNKIKPGIVDWNKVNKPPYKLGGQMKKIENCNYVVDLCRELKFSTVGIGGQDINSGNKTLTLAVTWQMMRAYTIKLLETLAGGGKTINDADIVDWANRTLADGSKSSSIQSFKDPSIATSLPVIDIVDCIRPGLIDYEQVNDASTDEDKLLNAKYAISMSRKCGARIYALAEDLVEVKPKMVLTVFACLMARSLQKA